jgi:hypothetical protein
MSLWLPLILSVLGFFTLVTWLDFRLNQNDDATTIGQFKKFQDSFKGEK